MAVISLSITDSVEQVVDGIPRFVSVTANISSVIFYTLDGSDPTTDSTMYVSKIQMPTDKVQAILKLFATNGTDSSPIIENIYGPDLLDGYARTAHSGTDAAANSTQGLNNQYPFGSYPIMPGQTFLGAAEAGFTTDNPLLEQIPSGYDADGYETGFTNESLIGVPTRELPIVFSTTDYQGKTGPGIGTFPQSTVQSPPSAPPEQSHYESKLFDPRAMVIFQDFTKAPNPDDPVQINRQFYTQSNLSKDSQGTHYFNSVDTPGPTGAFVRQHFNPTDQTMTYYYFNSRDNRWIISKTKYTPSPNAGNYYNLVFGRSKGSKFVFNWRVFKANYLF